jgi:bla regulator protein blaR1
MTQDLANHLWQSTLFAAIAGLLTLAFRRNRAQIRYSLWLAASIKFLVPFSIFMTLGSHLDWRTKAATSPAPIPLIVEQLNEPFVASARLAAAPQPHGSLATSWPLILGAIWAIGFAAIVFSWGMRWRQIHRALRAASPLELGLGVAAASSPEFFEPGVFGVFRPVLLLPEGIANHLTASQLEAILAHELSHIRRRDNLAAVLHMAVEVLFWFHPLVWWMGARLMQERERACDEEVLRMGSDPEVYAEGILKICERYVESPLPCVVGVTGANLKKRIEEIMENRTVLRLIFAKKAALAAAGLAAVALPIAIGLANLPAIRAQSAAASEARSAWETAAGGKMAFEVASVKPDNGPFRIPNFGMDDSDSFGATPPGNRFFADFGVISYVLFAYKLSLTGDQMQAMVAHLPSWVASQRFEIEAKARGNPTKDQMRLMMQSLLADRFKLAVHFETQQVPIYVLTLVKPGQLGPKLRPHSEGLACDATPSPEAASADPVSTWACGPQGMTASPDHTRLLAGGREFTMGRLASGLPRLNPPGQGSVIGPDVRPVVDQTGLAGTFDFRIEWSPASAEPIAPFGVEPDPLGPTFIEALHDQLGLKLQPAKGPVGTLVIDHIEPPTEN